MLMVFFPILLLILVNSFQSSPEQMYSFTRNANFQIEMKTYKLRTQFYVNNKFEQISPEQKYVIMTEIEHQYFQKLHQECNTEYRQVHRYRKDNNYPPGSWCYQYVEAKRIMQPGY